MSDWSAEFLRGVLDAAPEGITICEAGGDQPVVYINPAYTRLTGHNASDLAGRNLRILQGDDRDQPARQIIRDALERGVPCRVTVRNVRPDGTVFLNDLALQPLRNGSGEVTHFIGYHHDLSALQRTSDSGIRGVPGWVREDRVTGLRSRAYFDDLLQRDFALAQREARELALLLLDVDQMSCYNETFERTGGDACLKRIARVLTTAFRRGSDLVARWEGAGFVALLPNIDAERALEYAQSVAQRIHSQQLHHPRSTHRFVTVSVGVAVRVPGPDDTPEMLVRAAEAALTRAKAQGRNRALLAVMNDFAPPQRPKKVASTA